MGKKESIGVGLLGLGVVGGGVARALSGRAEALDTQVGCPLRLMKIAEKDLAKTRASQINPDLFTTDPSEVIADPEIDIIIEVLGGEHPAMELISDALGRGKYVVTSNKEVMAKHFPEFLSLAKEKGVDILYEASVGGGIPIIRPLNQCLAANEINGIKAQSASAVALASQLETKSRIGQKLCSARSLAYRFARDFRRIQNDRILI